EEADIPELTSYLKGISEGSNITIDFTDPQNPVISSEALSGEASEETLVGDTQIVPSATGSITATFDTKSQINLNMVGNVALDITFPILEVNQSCSRMLYVKPNGFDLTLPVTMTAKMSGFD